MANSVTTMSLTNNRELVLVARETCRKLRGQSTQAEKQLWEKLRDRRLQGLKFYRQHPIFIDMDGRETFFIADFYCHERKLVVELDGPIHLYRKHKDEQRSKILRAMGIRVIRLQNNRVEKEIEAAIGLLAKTISNHTSPSLPKRRGRGMSSYSNK